MASKKAGRHLSIEVLFLLFVYTMTNLLLESLTLQKLLDNSLDIICHLEPGGQILHINQAVSKILGYEPDELIGANIFDFVYEDDKEETYRIAERTIKEGKGLFYYTNRYVKKDGSTVYIEWTGTHDPDANEGCCIGRDVSARIKGEIKLKEQKEKLTMAASLAGLGYWEFDVVKNIGYWSDTMFMLHGLSRNDERGFTFESYLSMVHPEDRDKLTLGMSQLHLHEKSEERFRIIQPNGTVIHLHCIYGITKDSEGNVIKISGVARDITKEVTLEEKLRKEREANRRKLVKAVIDAQENERSKLGIELHDNVNQVLTTIKLYIELCLSSDFDKKDLQKKAVAHLTNCINEIRGISKALSAPTLGNIALEDSITDLINSVAETNKLQISSTLTGLKRKKGAIPTDLHLSIYRIVQEQLCNILKHSGARHTHIEIAKKQKKLELKISDDGVGFDTEKNRKGIGITNMMMRAKALGTSLNVQSSPGNGCTVSCCFQLP